MVDFPKSLSPKLFLKLLKAHKDPRSALALFDSATRHPGYAHSSTVFHHILRRLALVDSKLVSHVGRVVELIRSQQCKCDEDVALTVIKAYAKNSMPDEALHVFQRMDEIFGCSPGVRSYNSLLNAFVESNQWDRAESFFAYFGTVGVSPNLQTYNTMIKILCKKKKFGKARKLLKWMWVEGLKPDVFSYGTLISRLGKSGHLVGALELFDKMPERGVSPDATCYNILIHGYFRKGDFEKANEIWERLLKESLIYPNVVTYNVMINGFCKCRKFNESFEIWDRMKRNEREQDLYTYSSLIHGL